MRETKRETERERERGGDRERESKGTERATQCCLKGWWVSRWVGKFRKLSVREIPENVHWKVTSAQHRGKMCNNDPMYNFKAKA